MKILLTYLAGKIASHILMVWLFIGAVTGILNFIEILSRTADNPNSNLALVLKITLLKLPISLQTLLPFAILLGTALALLRLRRYSELVIIFTSGLRHRQLVALIALIGAIFGIILLLCDGFIASSNAQYRLYERNVLSLKQVKFNDIFAELKFYHETDEARHYIQLHYVDALSGKLGAVTVISADKDTTHLRTHIFAASGKVTPQGWLLEDVALYQPQQERQELENYLLPLNVSFQDLIVLSRPLDTIGFFALPGFIKLASKVGAQVSIYQMEYLERMITPLLFASFAAFAFGIVRLVAPRKSTGFVMLKCFLWALMLNFATNLIGTLGGAEQLSLSLAVFAQLFLSSGIALVVLMRPGIR